MFRSILAILLGFVVAGIVTLLIQIPGYVLYAPPQGFDWNDAEALRAYAATLPPGAFLIVLLSWFAGAFCGAWLAARIARRAPLAHALAIGVIQMAAGLYNLLTLPHPMWFWVAGLAAFPVAAVAAAALNRPKVAPAPVAV